MKILRTIEQIARDKQRDVVYVTFSGYNGDWRHPVPYWVSKEHPRHKITEWLIHNDVDWEDCHEFHIPEAHETYHGHFYIDIIHDKNDPTFQKLVSFLEDENGKVKPEFGEGTKFCLLPISVVLINNFYDELGY
jgi:hypothetical protein